MGADRLAELDECIRVAREYGTPDAASRFGLECLLRHRAWLVKEMTMGSGGTTSTADRLDYMKWDVIKALAEVADAKREVAELRARVAILEATVAHFLQLTPAADGR